MESIISIPGYDIKREMGRGGMATVYLAVQESLNRQVALKVMRPSLAVSGDFKQRFLNEGLIIAQLNHPNIVTVFDIGTHGEFFYISMELLPGGTLKEKIRQGLPLEQALNIAKTLASALGYAHERGFVHRDIKPINVLFRADGTAVLTDFGIAKALGTNTLVTATGLTFGSAGHMSPEQCLGKPVDGRSDLYSLGVVLWEMLTSSAPYEAEDAFALALKHATEPVPQLPPNLTHFQPVLKKLLAKRPDDRFATAEQFVVALDKVKFGKSSPDASLEQDPDKTLVKLPDNRLKANKSGLRKRSPIPIIGSVVVVMVIAVIYFLTPWFSQSDQDNKTSDQSAAIDLLQQQAREEEGTRSAESERKAEEERQAELTRRAEVERRQAELEREAELVQLLAQAQDQWQAGKLLKPAGDNAFESYRRVLELAPENSEAKGKLLKIGQMRLGIQYEQAAKQLMKEGNLQQSLAKVQEGLRLAPDYPGLLLMRETVQAKLAEIKPETVEERRRRKVEQLLARAERQGQSGRHTEPPGDNAYESYREVLALDPGNNEAREGLVGIGRIRLGLQYQREAEQLLRDGVLEASLAKVEEGLKVSPEHAGLLELRKQIQARLSELQR